MIQVATKSFLLDHGQQVSVGGCDHPKVNLQLFVATYFVNPPRLQYAQQFALHRPRQITNFIKKNSPAGGQLKGPRLGLVGTRERAFFVPEKFTFNQGLRYRPAVEHHECLARPRTRRMNRVRHEFLARPRFTRHQYRKIGARNTTDFSLNGQHRIAVAHLVNQRIGLQRLVANLPDLAFGLVLGQCVAHSKSHNIVAEWL